MSYMFIVVIGAVAGWVAGQALKGSENGIGIDLAAGAIGSCVLVLLSRLIGPAAASGMALSVIIGIIGAAGSVYAMRRYMKSKEVPVPVTRRKRTY